MYKPFKENSPLYLPDPLPENINCGYYLPGAEQPVQVELLDSWVKYRGYYIFLSTAIKSTSSEALTALEEALAADKSIQNPENTGALWLLNKDSINIYTILQTKKIDTVPVVSETTNLGFGTYQLPLPGGSPILLDEAAAELQIGYPTIEGAQATAIKNGIHIPVVGDQSGIAFGQAMINDFSSNPLTGWAVGFKYNMSKNNLSQFYPMFNIEPGRYLVFDMCWDPLHPTDIKRTNLTFTGISFNLEKDKESPYHFQIKPQKNPNLINSYWRTIYGKEIFLRPSLSGVNASQLVFQDCASQNEKEQAYYLTPKGDFDLCVPGEGGKKFRMLCGLAGTECIEFIAGDETTKGDILSFFPDREAYTNYYPVVNEANGLACALGTEISDSFLDNTYKTAWAVVQPNESNSIVSYFAAPEAANLYTASATNGLLNAFYAETAHFTNADPEVCFPMVPYAGINHEQPVGFEQDDIHAFELQIIGAARKQVISNIPLENKNILKEEGSVLTTTPQGLLATIQGLTWSKVLLAHNTEWPEDLCFINLSNELRNAFQTNELFLVVSDAKYLGTFLNTISIEGWKFNICVPTRNPDEDEDPDKEDILLLKFRKGSILDLIQDVNSWTDAAAFNYGQITSTQTWLIQYCNEAIAMADQNDKFAHFASLIQDPNWYGILSLKVHVDIGNFPKDLKGLLGAIDFSRFYAHHIGVQVNYLQSKTEDGTSDPDISIKKSNLFGLINYMDPGYKESPKSTDPKLRWANPADSSMDQVDYAYKVLTLQVVFENSAITNFESKLSLTARKWFDENASLNKPGSGETKDELANYSMLFEGHYENHDGHKTYTFLTRKELFYQYFMESCVLNYVEFIKAQFCTVSSVKDPSSPDIEKVTSIFTFYGYLNFKKQENFDIFSYGSETGDEPLKGLYFSNMALDVAFKLDAAKNETKELAVSFNPERAAFDQSISAMRQVCLGRGFPISPCAILSWKGEGTPQKSGYIHVVPPTTFNSNALAQTWYGLDFELHWGGPGALANQAGFTPHLLIAWSPGAETLRSEIFIRLPGTSSGGNILSLQNVLKLKVGSFRFTITEHEGKRSYNLLLTNIALSLIGLKFPPVGNTNLMLLGDPEQPGTLGWYGTYINEK